MKRDLDTMANEQYDLVVIGGGISGACIVRDAALRGLRVALVEKNDFASATSSASSKLIHGGLRYLVNLEIGLVRESLRERRIWSNIAPHMVDPLTFLLPSRQRKAFRNRLKMSLGLTAYDWLGYDRNRLDDPAKSLPGHKHLSREEVLAIEPELAAMDLTGAMAYYDYQMFSPERLALACIRDAVAHGAQAANYCEVIGFLRENGRVAGVQVRDRFRPGNTCNLRSAVTVNATGPWADMIMHMLTGGNGGAQQLIRSKGIHLITRPLTRQNAVAVPMETGHFFILPWRGHSLIGTTDTVYRGAPDKFHVTEKDISDFLDVVNMGLPGANLRREDVLHFYGGLRPLVDPSTAALNEEVANGGDSPGSYDKSRASEVFDHEERDGIAGVISAMGGKWTTSRSLAEQIVDQTCAKLGRDPAPGITHDTPVWGGDMSSYDQFLEDARARYVNWPPDIIENLVRNFGSKMDEVIALVQADSALGERLTPEGPDIAAAVLYAVREEMAHTVEDVLFRRTGMGTLGNPGAAVFDKVSALMAEELGWSKPKRTAMIEVAAANYTPRSRTRAIVNPHSMGDRTGINWPGIETKLRAVLGHVDTVFTDGPMAAKLLTREALKDGVDQVIAVGGDGTVNEVVNGFFERGKPVNPDAVIAVLASGTGGDFRRSFRIPESIDDQISRLAHSTIRTIDLGKLTYFDDSSGEEAVRYFDNIASFGLSGLTDRMVNDLKFGKRFGGKIAFQWGMFKALAAYQLPEVRIRVDDVYDMVLNVTTAAVCNGKFFGGGMKIAPEAEPDDGLFDVVIVRDVRAIELLRKSRTIYKGDHLQFDKVVTLRGRRVTAEPVDGRRPVLLDVDGEAPGRLPATFEIMPRALNLRY
ncbi:MAG: FAD-dependent oxidoreductase [Candidatus Hydrogenedentota bacterium]